MHTLSTAQSIVQLPKNSRLNTILSCDGCNRMHTDAPANQFDTFAGCCCGYSPLIALGSNTVPVATIDGLSNSRFRTGVMGFAALHLDASRETFGSVDWTGVVGHWMRDTLFKVSLLRCTTCKSFSQPPFPSRKAGTAAKHSH